MNIYQIAFLVLILLPPVFSIVLDKLSDRVKGLRWIEWSESILKLYLVEWGFVMFWCVFALLGTM